MNNSQQFESSYADIAIKWSQWPNNFPIRLLERCSQNFLNFNDYYPMRFVVSDKLKIHPLNVKLQVFESFLTIYIWNTGLISVELFLSTKEKPNKSYQWLRDQWRFKRKSGSIRDLSFLAIKGVIEKCSRFQISKTNFFLNSEPTMYLLRFFPITNKSEEESFILKIKKQDKTLQPDWFAFNFQNSERILYFNCSRGYFYLQDSKNESIPKQIRIGLLFTLQFILGYHLWIKNSKIESYITTDPNVEVIRFFLMNINPEKLSSEFISPFHVEPFYSFLQVYFEKSKYVDDYKSLENKIAQKYQLLDPRNKIEWEKSIPMLNSDIIAKKLSSLQNIVITDEYHFIKDNPMLLFAFAVAVEKYFTAKDQESDPFERQRKSEISISTLVEQSKELSEKKKNGQVLEYPFGKLPFDLYFSSKRLYSEHPLLKLYQKGFLEASERRRGRPRNNIHVPVIFMLHHNWTNREKLNIVFKL